MMLMCGPIPSSASSSMAYWGNTLHQDASYPLGTP